ncbi:hypothetical protein QC823_15445 [Halomonas vilamensis]|uniref:Uncharacterized protein n=1 Tax=Vreelandella vilamensis TaxID=531309 RepID=A0ABU1H7U0_9GAMM|nr:hypothetical protein [Halomonas vilamensis]MDR5900359.1 hypothetical protein [Halomonas vilamensis]
MALSPWRVNPLISFDDLACLLAEVDPTNFEHRYNIDDDEIALVWKWQSTIMGAIQAERVNVIGSMSVKDWRDNGDYMPSGGQGLEAYDPKNDCVHAQLDKRSAFNWLKALDVKDDEIPEALHPPTSIKAPKRQEEKPVHHRSKTTYLKLIEALALEAMGGDMPAEPYKAAGMLQTILNKHGLHLDEETIAKVIKEVQASRDDRDSVPY